MDQTLGVAAATATAAEAKQPQYYRARGSDIADAFRNFDDKINFDCFEQWAQESNRDNFIVDYGDDQAWCAFDLDAEQLEKLVKAPVRFSMHLTICN